MTITKKRKVTTVTKEPIINDLHSNNPTGAGYTTKEILTAHIRDDKSFQEEIRNNYLKKELIISGAGLIVTWLAWLTVQLIGLL